MFNLVELSCRHALIAAQFGVLAIQRQQTLVITSFNDLPVVQNYDHIGILREVDRFQIRRASNTRRAHPRVSDRHTTPHSMQNVPEWWIDDVR